jgi:hypothetical protein
MNDIIHRAQIVAREYGEALHRAFWRRRSYNLARNVIHSGLPPRFIHAI